MTNFIFRRHSSTESKGGKEFIAAGAHMAEKTMQKTEWKGAVSAGANSERHAGVRTNLSYS